MNRRIPYLLALLTLLVFAGCGFQQGEGGLSFPTENRETLRAAFDSDRAREDLGQMIRDTLQSDHTPTGFQRNTRTNLPVYRFNPYFQCRSGLGILLRLESLRCRFREVRQHRLTADHNAILDMEGHYIFALRKIII